jgi:radical SAM protein with 4Fe4S-binding SPASM domain
MKKFCACIELTNNCNFNCPICPHHDRKLHHRERGFISQEVFDRALGQCQRHASAVSIGFFGEQLLHPKYNEFILRMKRRAFKLVVNTNISLCTRETFNAWIGAGVNEVRLSLDAANPNVFNRCRPGAVRDLNGRPVSKDQRLAAIHEKIKHWFSLPKHRPTRIVYVKSSFNKGEKRKFVRQWRPHLKGKDHLMLKQIVSYGGKIKNPYVLPHRCNVWEMKYMMIGWNGETSPCNLDVNLLLGLGNIMNSSINKLYTSPKAKKLRKVTGCGRNIEPCKTCIDSNNWSKNEKVCG